MDVNRQPQFNKRYAKASVGLIACVCILLTMFVAGSVAQRFELENQASILRRSIEVNAMAIRSEVTTYAYLPFTIAEDSRVLRAITFPEDDHLIKKGNDYLEKINRQAQSNTLYVMDRHGRTLMASNWNLKSSFIGQDYANRPYVIDALAGKKGMFYGVGKTTGEPGLFISSPIWHFGQLMGVVAAKIDLKKIGNAWAIEPYPVMLSDQHGIFFMGSVSTWLYQSYKDIDEPDQAWLREHNVYGSQQIISKIPWATETFKDSIYLLTTTLNGSSVRFIALSEPVQELGWTLTVTEDYATITNARNRAWIISGMACTLLVLGALYWQLRRRQFSELEELVQKRTQDLNEAHAFQKSMEDSLLIGMRARDLEGHIIYVNPAMSRITGYSEQELLGKLPPFPYWNENELERHWSNNADTLSGKASPSGFESKIRHRNGQEVFTLVYTAPLIDARGQHTGWMSSVVDITALKQLEALHKEQESQLQHVQRRAIMDEMSASLAHELTQPIIAIGANTEAAKLFAEQSDAKNLQKSLDRITKEKQRAADIVKTIRNHVRTKTMGDQTISINQLVIDVLRLLRSEIKSYKVKVIQQFDASNPLILGDKILLEQVLVNLIFNGLQAMDKNAPENKILDISTQRIDNSIKIMVGDTGTGVTEKVAEQLFKKFVTTKQNGLGIGLSICRTIIENHGGRLNFENKTSMGATFFFHLPCKTMELSN